MKVDLTIDKPRGVTRTSIEWADYTANPIRARDIETGEVGWHCRKVSAGCANCYAEAINNRFGTKRAYTAKGSKGIEQMLDEGVLRKILRMRPKPGPDGLFTNGRDRPALFLGDMMDLFYGDEADRKACESAGVPFEPIPFELLDRIFAVMALRPDIDFLILTKRPGRMAEYFVERSWGDVCEIARVDYTVCGDCPEEFKQLAGLVVHERMMSERGEMENYFRFSKRKAPLPDAWPLPNVWLGTSCEDQDAADKRIPDLLKCPAAVRFISAEPLIGAVELGEWIPTGPNCPECGHPDEDHAWHGRPNGCQHVEDGHILCGCRRLRGEGRHRARGEPMHAHRIDWVIGGGESGPGARPSNIDWHSSLLRQCRAAGVPYFQKQLGKLIEVRNDTCSDWPDDGDGWIYDEEQIGWRMQGDDVVISLADPKGGDPSEWPEPLRVREMPAPQRAEVAR